MAAWGARLVRLHPSFPPAPSPPNRVPGNLARALFGNRLRGSLDLKHFKCVSVAVCVCVCVCVHACRAVAALAASAATARQRPPPPTHTPHPTPHSHPRAFLEQLHDDITRLEFAHYDVAGAGRIRGADFARSVAAAADIKTVDAYLNKVGRRNNHCLCVCVCLCVLYAYSMSGCE